jgi:hypothetical protein
MSPYEELLNHEKWHEKRLEILARDGKQCLNCKNSEFLKSSRRARFKHFYLVWQSDMEMKANTKFYYQAEIEDTETGLAHKAQAMVAFKEPLPHISKFDLYYEKEIEGDHEKYFVNIVYDKQADTFVHARGLQVHHIYYQDGKMPWDYPSSALKTLCWICHQRFHATERVAWLDATGKLKGKLTPCIRCGGTGYLPQYDYYMNGICFNCWGIRYLEFRANVSQTI